MNIKFSCDIKIKHNFNKIEKLINDLPKTIKESVEDILKNIQGCSIRLEGHNQEGILVELVETSTMKVKGRVYTDKEKFSWAMFEHFGTGEYAEMPHIGTTKHFIESGYSQWFIPVTKVEKTLHYPIIEIQGTQFYIAHGVKANHFMTDASFETREQNKEIVVNKINEMLKEVAK